MESAMRAGRSLGSVGGNMGGPAQPKQRTINDRLNEVATDLGGLCYRLNAILARVNGTPQAADSGAVPPASFALQQAVDNIEAHVKNLHELVGGAESIA